MEDRKAQIKELEEQADKILHLKNKLGQRRPILIEFCGTPKSGKTTSITSLNIFLKRNDFKTEIIQEMASICPVENKTHPYFNSWTLFSSLAETLKLISLTKEKVDIIIVDRSIFDAMCWFEWLNINTTEDTPYLDDKTYEGFRKLFLETTMWSSLFDLTIIFKANPTTAMNREYANLLTDKTGTIMNDSVLNSFNNAIDNCVNKYKDHFRRVETIDTSEQKYIDQPAIVGLDLTKKVLHLLQEVLMEQIGYFDETIRNTLGTGVLEYDLIKNCKLQYGYREDVENSNHIQPIPIVVYTNKERNKVLVVKKNLKRTERTSPEAHKYLCYLGGHIRIEDEKNKGLSIIDIMKHTLHREIQEETGESIYFEKNIDPFLIYTPDSVKSRKHLAVCFVVETDLDNKRFRLTSDEFIGKTKNSKSGSIMSINELLDIQKNFESWSTEILNYVFKTKVPYLKQIELFID